MMSRCLPGRSAIPWGAIAVLAGWLLCTTPAAAVPSLEELQVYVKQHPENIRAVYQLGRMHTAKGNYGQSIRLFMYLLKRPRSSGSSPGIGDKMRMELLNRIALAYYKSSNDRNAEKVCTIALKRYPENEFARKVLAAIAKRRATATRSVAESPSTQAEEIKLPPVTAEQAKKAYEEGLKSYNLGKAQVDQGNVDQARGYFAQAREQFETALRGKHEEARCNYYIGMSFLKEGTDDTGDLDRAKECLQTAYRLMPNDKDFTPEITFGLAAAHGLLDEADEEIQFYEKTLELRPNDAEAHFRTSLAYDKAKRADWSAKSFEHAKKAIKLDPNYKKKFQPMIRNSHVAKKVAGIIHEIIQKSEDSQIPDEEAARYAEEIGKILGDNNIKSEMLGDEAGSSQESLKEMIKDPSKRQKLREFWDKSSGGDPEKVNDLLEKASPGQKAAVDKFLSSDKNKEKLQKYLGNSVNPQPE